MTITDGGVYVLTGVHADDAVTITDGTLNISKCYEGIEGQTIDISGGTIDIVSSDDGLSAAGGADQSGFGGRGPDSNGGNMGTPLHLPCRGVLTFCFLLYHRGGRFTVHARVHERLHRAQLGGRARAAGREQVQRDRAAAWRECRLKVGG